jgi:hypothetical protein
MDDDGRGETGAAQGVDQDAVAVLERLEQLKNETTEVAARRVQRVSGESIIYNAKRHCSLLDAEAEADRARREGNIWWGVGIGARNALIGKPCIDWDGRRRVQRWTRATVLLLEEGVVACYESLNSGLRAPLAAAGYDDVDDDDDEGAPSIEKPSNCHEQAYPRHMLITLTLQTPDAPRATRREHFPPRSGQQD